MTARLCARNDATCCAEEEKMMGAVVL